MSTWPVLRTLGIELRRADLYGPLVGDEVIPIYSPPGHGRQMEGRIPYVDLLGEGGGGGGSGSTDWISPQDHGLIADGDSHPLSESYSSLTAAQAVYPAATSLTQEIDYCACKKASDIAFGKDLDLILDENAWTPITANSDGTTIEDDTKDWTPYTGNIPGSARGEQAHKEVYRRKTNGAIDHSLIISNTENTLTVGVTGGFGGYGSPTVLPNGPVTQGEDYQIVYRRVTAFGSATEIVDDTQNWTINEHAGHELYRRFMNFAETTPSVRIASNTATTLTLATPLDEAVSVNNHYAIGYGEHAERTYLNKPLWLSAGTYVFGDDTWMIRNLVGGRIDGAGERSTILRGNKAVLAFDGVWYTDLSNFSVECVVANVDETAALDVDGVIPGHSYTTRTVHGVTLHNMLIDGGGSKYALALCRQGDDDAEGSECLYSKVHLQNASVAEFYQNGTSAVASAFVGGNFQSVSKLVGNTVPPGYQVIATDAAFTLTPYVSPYNIHHTGTLTADRAVTLSTTGAYAGLAFKISRSGGGAFNLNVGAGPLKAMATNTWAEFTYNGSAYYLSAAGSLFGEGLIVEEEPASTYTPVVGDGNIKLKAMTNASGVLVTLPADVFTAGTVLAFMQASTGPVTIAGGIGVTIDYPDDLLPRSAGEGHTIHVVVTASDEFQILGGLYAPRLDALLQLSVVSQGLTAPPDPTALVDGDCYIPLAPATGAWAGHANHIAQFIAGSWTFYVPQKGWLSGIDDEDVVLRYDGANWVSIYAPETGTWTPSLIGLSAGTATLATADGGYMKSGEWVFAYGHIVTDDASALSGQLAIGNIPFEGSTLPGVAGRTGGAVPFWAGLTLPAGSFGLVVFMQDTTNFRLYRSVITAGNQTVTDAHITGAVTLYFNIHYRIA